MTVSLSGMPPPAPLPLHEVEIMRAGIGAKRVSIAAPNRDESVAEVLSLAGNHLYRECSASYFVAGHTTGRGGWVRNTPTDVFNSATRKVSDVVRVPLSEALALRGRASCAPSLRASSLRFMIYALVGTEGSNLLRRVSGRVKERLASPIGGGRSKSLMCG